jgi:phosphate transport system substrate-binding protein
VDPPASAKDGYPISGLTFLLFPKQGKDPKKTGALKQFIAYVVTQGQTQAQSMDYAPISASLQQQDENLLSQVGGTAQPAQAKLSGTSLAP